MDLYPVQAEVEALENAEIPHWIDRRFLRPDPLAFASNAGPENYFADFAHECSLSFNIDPNGIYCIGSGAVGLSFSPRKIVGARLKVFNKMDSDIDLALISPHHFETAWRDLRTIAHSTYGEKPSAKLRKKLDHQRRRLFDGAILANELMSSISFGPEWSTNHRRISLDWSDKLQLEKGGVNIWIYKDYWSVRSYVADGIVSCIKKIRSTSDE